MAFGSDFNVKKFPRLGTNVNTLRRLLPYIGCDLVTLAHNHCYDNLDVGFTNTIRTLKELDISFIGAGLEDDSKSFFLTNGDIKICFINYVHNNTHPSRPEHTRIKQSVYDKDKILSDINRIKNKVDHIVLLFHWGGDNEGYMYPCPSQLSDARSFIDAGASLIVGGHSHTLQPFEVYKGRSIFYSLGNFCFDDTLCDGHINVRKPKEKESMILQVEFKKNSYVCHHIFIKNENLRLNYANEIGIKFKRRNAYFKLIFSSKCSYRLYYIWTRYILKIFKYICNPSLIKNRIHFVINNK